MKAFRMHGVGDVRLEDVPEPQAGPGDGSDRKFKLSFTSK